MRLGKNRAIDQKVVGILERSGLDIACSVPCTLLAGILDEIAARERILHVPVTREEEGVGICAGAWLGGSRPLLLMQNSGLGNSLNALLSLTSYYNLGLFILIGYRGRPSEEKIMAQVPVGRVTKKLLSLIKAERAVIDSPDKIYLIENLFQQAYEESKITAALLPPILWE